MNNNLIFNEIADDELIDFLKEKCADYEHFEYLTEAINKTEVKHSNKIGKMPKFTQKLYVFVYSRLIGFPELNIDYEMVTKTKIASMALLWQSLCQLAASKKKKRRN